MSATIQLTDNGITTVDANTGVSTLTTEKLSNAISYMSHLMGCDVDTMLDTLEGKGCINKPKSERKGQYVIGKDGKRYRRKVVPRVVEEEDTKQVEKPKAASKKTKKAVSFASDVKTKSYTPDKYDSDSDNEQGNGEKYGLPSNVNNLSEEDQQKLKQIAVDSLRSSKPKAAPKYNTADEAFKAKLDEYYEANKTGEPKDDDFLRLAYLMRTCSNPGFAIQDKNYKEMHKLACALVAELPEESVRLRVNYHLENMPCNVDEKYTYQGKRLNSILVQNFCKEAKKINIKDGIIYAKYDHAKLVEMNSLYKNDPSCKKVVDNLVYAKMIRITPSYDSDTSDEENDNFINRNKDHDEYNIDLDLDNKYKYPPVI